MRVLLDINVILDAMLQRQPWQQDADDIMRAAAKGKIDCALTTHSLATVFYLGRKSVGTLAARAAVRRYMTAFEILSVDKQTLLDADAQPGTDFEDNILIAAAVSSSVDAIVTRNPADFSHSPIPVWEPAELLRRLSSPGPSANTP